MKKLVGLCAALVLIASAARGEPPPGPQPTPSPDPAVPKPSPSPEPTPAPRRLRLDIERYVQRALESEGGPPRFATSVEVDAESPQAAFERHLQGLDLECGPTGGGAPTEAETRAVRPHLSPSADFLALGKWIKGKVQKGKGPDRYFLYRVRTAKGVSYSLRAEPVPDALLGVPGTTFELVATFPDQGSATRAWQRLEQGFASPTPTGSGAPPPSWTTSPCRPTKD